MGKTILITGPSLAPAAVAVLSEAGYEPVYLPPYADAAVLMSHVVEHRPVAIISRMGRIEASIFEVAPQLRIVSKHGVGVDNIDIDAASAHDVPVIVASGANAVSVAEHAMALLFAVAKRVVPLDRSLREGRWEKPNFKGRELSGSTMGLVAFGAIAQHTARLAKAFDMSIIAYDPFAADETFTRCGVQRASSLEDLLRQCDVISLHCPMTEQTRGLINHETLSLMREDAILINTARGGLIDEPALVKALDAGQIAGAGLDTFATEPPAADHPFFASDRVVLTPHIGGVTAAANVRVGVEAAQGIVDYLAGRPLAASRIVNRAQLSKLAQPQFAGELH
ncbi:hydroxyacid dehydrogenase [Devosia sp. XJ19-1]|uniref:Hydroxyacid dehydrogenase n=1 Tax=Devosia ureilytica TaxID=2952754 RepID=A0A9Q4AKH8_9HYPH|nr:hydroxyacid dehydrogenase [Devosia ureilytica]MCP8882410.1 hydroxyacid dehydrogenase [Devosia ureilytica]MCP8885703.1 hydroxyacid dehydrogenase [Devosia ureilytica]